MGELAPAPVNYPGRPGEKPQGADSVARRTLHPPRIHPSTTLGGLLLPAPGWRPGLHQADPPPLETPAPGYRITRMYIPAGKMVNFLLFKVVNIDNYLPSA